MLSYQLARAAFFVAPVGKAGEANQWRCIRFDKNRYGQQTGVIRQWYIPVARQFPVNILI